MGCKLFFRSTGLEVVSGKFQCQVDLNMEASLFNNLKAKIHSESKNGLPSPLYTSEIFWILCDWSFWDYIFQKNQKIVHLTNPGSFFSLQSLRSIIVPYT